MQNDEFKDVGKGISFGYNTDKAMSINPKPPKKFEYSVKDFAVRYSSEIQIKLNEEGQQGWELVSLDKDKPDPKYALPNIYYTAYFKREKIEPCN